MRLRKIEPMDIPETERAAVFGGRPELDAATRARFRRPAPNLSIVAKEA